MTRFFSPRSACTLPWREGAAGLPKRTCKPERRDAVQLRNQLGAQARELLIGDRS